ncbi:MAG: VanZ family protein [Desulfobacterales bacterium]|nr:VanZ family protein [Desulfobacterales bacterium]
MFIPFMKLAHWSWGYPGKTKLWFWQAFAAGLLLAAVSECLQWLLPYRTFNTWDLCANYLGIVIGALIVRWGRYTKRKMIELKIKLGF